VVTSVPASVTARESVKVTVVVLVVLHPLCWRKRSRAVICSSQVIMALVKLTSCPFVLGQP